ESRRLDIRNPPRCPEDSTKDQSPGGLPDRPAGRLTRVWYHVRMKLLFGVCLGTGLLIPTASSQSLPDGPGKDVFQKICNACHEAEVVIGMKQTKQGWSATVDEMVSRGAEGTD